MANKLELTWIGKNDEVKIEPRLLIENKELSNCKNDENTENMIIHGDNLLALKALEGKYAGKIKCIYIDPPYNTGSAFEHYDDNLEHSIWLELMYKRIQILYNLLADDGVFCCQIDIQEMAYLKILLDEIFSRTNLVNIICIKTKIAGVSGSNLGKSLQDNTEYILIYAKDFSKFLLKEVPIQKIELMKFINNYKVEGKSWKYTSVLKYIDDGEYIKDFKAGNGDTIKLYRHNDYNIVSIKQIADSEFAGDLKKAYYKYIDKVFRTTNAQTSIRTKVIEETSEYEGKGMFSIEYVPIKGRNEGQLYKAYYKDNNLVAWLNDVVSNDGEIISKIEKTGNLWDDIQYNNLTKEGDVQFPNGKKPEEIIKRIISMSTDLGDLVLDSFLGSGTTCAVAQKMGRKYIGIEMGEHAYTHCKARLDKVIEGTDKGGITEEVDWQGGGAYKFYELAPSLIKIDELGNEVINESYDANMLATAVALHEGYEYSPDEKVYWKQSKSNEKSYLYVTTNIIDKNYIDNIHSNMGDDEFLVIACKNYNKDCKNLYKNIIIKKIPQMLLDKCEFSKENYNLNIINPPIYDDEEEQDD